MKIYVGNLAGQTVEADLMRAFEPFGQVGHVNIARLSRDGSSREFGYVDVAADDEGRAAITGLNGSELHGHVLQVVQVHKKSKGR
jgi:RNA recognition motif-containing protein